MLGKSLGELLDGVLGVYLAPEAISKGVVPLAFLSTASENSAVPRSHSPWSQQSVALHCYFSL